MTTKIYHELAKNSLLMKILPPKKYPLYGMPFSSAVIPCTTGDVRLVNGNDFRGRLELCNNEVWGTVCNKALTSNDAETVCNKMQLGSDGEENC